MGLFSKTGFFGKIWAGVKKDVTVVAEDIADVFKDVQLEFLPEVAAITQDVENAINSGTVEDIVAALSPELGGIPADLLKLAQATIPKVLASELGLEALGTTPTAAEATAWAQSVIAAFASASFTKKSQVYTTLVTTLVQDFNQGKAENATWLQWIQIGVNAVQQTQAAIAQAAAAPGNATEAAVVTLPAASSITTPAVAA